MFDVFEVYTKQAIEDYSEYIVTCNDESIESKIVFPDELNAVYGFVLKAVKLQYTILRVRKPSRLNISNSSSLVSMVWNSKFSNEQKKDLININLGLVEKQKNKRSLSKVYKSFDEAYYYRSQIGGVISPICEVTEQVVDGETMYVYSEEKLFMLIKTKVEKLTNGFIDIKNCVYDMVKLQNYTTVMKLKEHKIKVLAIKTDSILVEAKHEKAVLNLFDFSNKLGCYKIETDKHLPQTFMTRKDNKIEFVDEISTCIDMKNERDSKEAKAIVEGQNCIILGTLPGVGKTHMAGQYGGDTLFVSPYNKLCQQLKKKFKTDAKNADAITIYKLFGLTLNITEHGKRAFYDISNFKCIVFDEVLLNSIDILQKIAVLVKNHPEIRFLFTGDCNQMSPLGCKINNVSDVGAYQMKCLKQICPNYVVLNECKRLEDPDQQKKLEKLKKAIFNTSIDLMTTFKKFDFKIIDWIGDLETTKNITNFNFRASNVIDHILKYGERENTKKIFGKPYWKGLELICRKHYQKGAVRLFMNFSYTLVKFNDTTITIVDENEGLEMVLPLGVLKTHFSHPYAQTCSSSQGLTIDEPYTIFDSNIPYTNRQWIWTAITRTTDLNNITIFEHDMKEVSRFQTSFVNLYFKNKVENYKEQDNKAERKFDEKEYIDYKWIVAEYEANQICPLCSEFMALDLNEAGRITSNISVDRVDNSISHVKSNCKLMCVSCNCAKH